MLYAVLLLALSSLDTGDKQSKGEVKTQVLKELTLKCADLLPKERLQFYADKIATEVCKARTTALRKQLLKDLPQAIDFHHHVLLPFADVPDLPGFKMFRPSKEVLTEGAEHELSYLVARVARAAQREINQEAREKIHMQIDQIMATAASRVREQAGKDVDRSEIEEEYDSLASAWKSSLDKPYNACLDRPLTDKELEAVLIGLGEAAKNSVKKRGASNVKYLVSDVREAAYKASAACFSDFTVFNKKTKQWWDDQKKAQKQWYLKQALELTDDDK